ncbi:MAG TPA: thioredoxin domain-containing protein, partial [Acidimicrobiales bacterium]|nr:thioredoxin domain-containing protein [Acidimicrobiales bacterium]
MANHLASQTSPYLLQHAHNPVDWWPWCEEAFAEASRRDLPVLISVGYSACHWCHVMAHESFEDPEVARALNDNFVAVKVDREERPDVDALYMEAVQLVSGHGGWPMTVLASPDGRPFWGGTYLPRSNFLQLIDQVARLWTARRHDIESDADELAGALQRGSALPGTGRAEVLPDVLAKTVDGLLARQDPQWGGFAGAPKFPQPWALEALARQWWRAREPSALAALRRALDAMSSGGIYDHLAGGFARYSTDRQWLVPHFEKMLYDNALLLLVYTHAWQLTGELRYRQVVEETASYLLAPPLRLAEGAWASAEDADSEGEEGRFYTWSRAEVEQVAGAAVADWYGTTAAGNWKGTNVLWRPGIGDLARPPEIEEGRQRLMERRVQRPRPGLDSKVLTEWNAMAVAALAYAGRALDRGDWVGAAAGTAKLLLERSRRPDGRWLRSPRSGPVAAPPLLAYAGDYAWLVEAFTRLGEATGEKRWTDAARETATGMIDLFWDVAAGAFFTSGRDGEQLIARLKDIYDGALPSANTVAAGALARIGELTGERRFVEVAESTVLALAPAMSRAPSAFPGLAMVADCLRSPRQQVVVASSDPVAVRPVWARYLPTTVLAWGEPYPSPLWEGR